MEGTGSGPCLPYRTNTMATVRKVTWSRVSLQSRGRTRGELIAFSQAKMVSAL